jgi:small subunit ribosomal protein S3
VGQKVNPTGLRVGIMRPWSSRWFADKGYSKLLHEDLKIKEIVKKRLFHAGVARIEIMRAASKCAVDIYTARPGIVIGKRGAGIDTLKNELQQMTSKEISLNIKEVRKAELDSQLVAENIAMQLERRVAFRRVIKRAVQSAIKLGAKGIKVRIAGRLGGAEIARAEWYMEGSVPLHTLRANIDYGFTEAKTTYGQIGVKVWVHRGSFAEPREQAEDGVMDSTANG